MEGFDSEWLRLVERPTCERRRLENKSKRVEGHGVKRNQTQRQAGKNCKHKKLGGENMTSNAKHLQLSLIHI